MNTISLRLSDADNALFRGYAAMNNQSITEMIKNAVREKIEDEYDLKTLEEYENERAAGTLKTRPIDELWKELDI